MKVIELSYRNDVAGSIKVTYRDARDGKNIVHPWTVWAETPLGMRLVVNLRQQFRDEIVLDVDGKDRDDCLAKTAELLLRLFDEKLSFQVWDCGKGLHVHLIFPEMLEVTDAQRHATRKAFCERYDCDAALASANQMISIEGRRHHKRDFVKCLVADIDFGANTLPAWTKEALGTREAREKIFAKGETLLPELVGKNISCPWHTDDTPSLHVYEDHWHCFGCHTHGSHKSLARILGVKA